jgi:tRNA 5-methylaminomethyl-2-thiouridine biosynthesis bifunctional protein
MTGEKNKIETAEVDWEANAPRSVFFDDIYFSGDGLAETQHVFLAGNNLAARFGAGGRFCVGELGFGTGLNFLAAWDLWRRTQKPPGARLDFFSVEKHPLEKAALARALGAWPALEHLSEKLVAAYPVASAGFHRFDLDETVTLTLAIGDAAAMLASADARIDAWFLDGFAPSKNPSMWSEEIFTQVMRLSAPGATASTFTVAGAVKRALTSAGFEIAKRPGFGRKREMLAAQAPLAHAPGSSRAPWYARPKTTPLQTRMQIGVIGGGVAGASLAHALRTVGCSVTIIDARAIAAGASGNPAGLVMPRLDLGGGAAARFFVSAYRHCLTTICNLDAEHNGFFNRCGVLLKANDDADAARQAAVFNAGLLPSGWIESTANGLFFPNAGVVDPRGFCLALAADTPLITKNAARIERATGRTIVHFDDGETAGFDAVIIANGRDALRFAQIRSLPLSGTMGQVDHYPEAAAPAHAIAAGPYIAPAPGGGVVIGATYEKISAEQPALCSTTATAENLRRLAEISPMDATALARKASTPRAAVRCQTPDRLPVVGAIPDWGFYSGAYDGLRLGKMTDYPSGEFLEGIYVLTGLGSRGMVTAPLCAAMIVADLIGGPAPVERDISEALHPARFFIRDLKRARKVRAN